MQCVRRNDLDSISGCLFAGHAVKPDAMSVFTTPMLKRICGTFPKSYLKKPALGELRENDQLVNYALMEWAERIAVLGVATSMCLE